MMNIVATYALTNTATLNIYQMDFEDSALYAGVNMEEAVYCPIDTDHYGDYGFWWDEMFISFSDCMRVC